ncbi:MAG: sigma 54-interacting transcriptional regulator [Pseudomonadota bacterium]
MNRDEGETVIVAASDKRPAWLDALAQFVSELIITNSRELEVAVSEQAAGSGYVIAVIDTSKAARIGRLLALGACDVVPVSQTAISHAVASAQAKWVSEKRLIQEVGLVGNSPAIRNARRQIVAAAELPELPVLVLGESGTGKMLAARAIHALDAVHCQHPFQTVDCGAATPELFASDLFGHLKGAFTGAEHERMGGLTSAKRGCLVLDEIGELPMAMQPSLLGVLQEMTFRPVGSDKSFEAECRVLALTNKRLPQSVQEGNFRADLFHRLDGVRVEMPSLADRNEDIEPLFRELLSRHGGAEVELEDGVEEALCQASWPGNVRQLEMVARIAAARAYQTGLVRLADLPVAVLCASEQHAAKPRSASFISGLVRASRPLDEIVSACSERAVEMKLQQLAVSHPNEKRTQLVRRAARQLGVSERTIYNRLNGAPSQVNVAAN